MMNKYRVWNASKKYWLPDSTIKELPIRLIGCCVPSTKAQTDMYQWSISTGLLDKNGKEIFVGDLVKRNAYVERGYLVDDHRLYRVIQSVDGTFQPFHEDSLKSNSAGGRCAYSFLPITMPIGKCTDFEVVDNVYEIEAVRNSTVQLDAHDCYEPSHIQNPEV